MQFFNSFLFRFLFNKLNNPSRLSNAVKSKLRLFAIMYTTQAIQRNRFLRNFEQTHCLNLKQIQPNPLQQSETLGLNGTKIRYPVGYHNCDLPQVIRKINNVESETQINALENLNNAMKNNEIRLYVIKKSNTLISLKRILNECLRLGDTDDRKPLLVCELLKLIALREIGAQKIVECKNLFDVLFRCVKSMNRIVCLEASQVIELVAVVPSVSVKLLNMNFLNKIKPFLESISTENEHLYNLLAILFQLDPNKGLNEIYFEFLNNKLNLENQYLQSALKCFALLINCHRGQHLCDIFVVMRKLNSILLQPGLDLKTYEYAALSLQNCTHSFQSKMAGIEYEELPNVLIKHAQTRENAYLQMYALQSLRQLTDNYNIKMIVRKNNYANVQSIESLSKVGRKIKRNLLDYLNFQVFDCY